jgi:hypothetical protein
MSLLTPIQPNGATRELEGDLQSSQLELKAAPKFLPVTVDPRNHMRSQAQVLLTATIVRSAMIQAASLLACDATRTTGSAVLVRPFSMISPSRGPIVRF